MIAQVYDDADYVRIFDFSAEAWRQALMDCFTNAGPPIGTDVADAVIKRCGLRRTTPWKRYSGSHFWEASVSFNRKQKPKQMKPKENK